MGYIQNCLIFCLLFVKMVVCQIQKVYEIKDPNILANYSAVSSDRAMSKDAFYDYELEKIKHKPVILRCFTCHYTKRESYDYGMANCDDPFDERGIPVVYCEGFCAITRSVLAGYETYMVIRSCLPNCKNIYDEETKVECCFGNLCNGAKNVTAIWKPDRSLIIVLFIFIIVQLMFLRK